MNAIRTLPLAAAALMMLGACVTEAPTDPATGPATDPAGACRPEDAARLVGQVNPGENVIRAVTGAETVRQVGPNQPMTMDYRFDRATIVKDPVTGRVLRATCG